MYCFAFGGRAMMVSAFLEGDGKGHLDSPRAREGGMVGGLYAIFAPSEGKSQADDPIESVIYDMPVPPPLELTHAQRATLEAGTASEAHELARAVVLVGMTPCHTVTGIIRRLNRDRPDSADQVTKGGRAGVAWTILLVGLNSRGRGRSAIECASGFTD
jgi:hypothetical protein